jgi:hypothetical protein
LGFYFLSAASSGEPACRLAGMTLRSRSALLSGSIPLSLQTALRLFSSSVIDLKVILDDIDENGLKYIEIDGNKQKLRENLLGFF